MSYVIKLNNKIINYKIATWSDYQEGECTKTCDGGRRLSTRYCLHGNVGEVGCLGGTQITRGNCNEQPCSMKLFNLIKITKFGSGGLFN